MNKHNAETGPPPLHIESLAHLLHNESDLARFVAWGAMPPEAHDAYRARARHYAAVLLRVVASEVVNADEPRNPPGVPE